MKQLEQCRSETKNWPSIVTSSYNLLTDDDKENTSAIIRSVDKILLLTIIEIVSAGIFPGSTGACGIYCWAQIELLFYI